MFGSIGPAPAEAAMCSVLYLREFIKERLTAVCEEIFSEVQKTIVQYEEEISRQRRLLDISRKPDTNSHIIVVQQQHAWEEKEGLTDQQVCNQERNSSLDQEDPEPPQIKEEKEELCSSQEGEQFGLKQEADTFMVTLTYEESDHGEPEPNSEQLLSYSSPEAEVKKRRRHRKRSHSPGVESPQMKEEQEDPEPPQIKEEQEDPEPSQMKEQQEKLCSSQEGEQFGLKQEADTFMVTLTYEKSDHGEPEPNSEQLLSYSSPEAEVKKRRHHTKRSHSRRLDNAPVSQSQSQTDTRKRSVQCDTCGKTFIYKSHLTEHLRVHTGAKPHSCITCGKTFSQKSGMELHARIHTGEKLYPCNTCGKRFNWKSDLERHTRSHSGEKPHSCSICGKRFGQKSYLEDHVRIHTGEKPYTCSICGKRFIQKTNLKTHMRIHTGEKPYPCSTCGRRFGQKSDLDRHARIHTGEKPFSCGTCGKRFIEKSSLYRHIRIHTGEKPYLCNTCGKRFTWRMQLKKHMRIHAG